MTGANLSGEGEPEEDISGGLLTVDIGNSNIKLLCYKDGKVVWRDTIPTPEINYEIAAGFLKSSQAIKVAVSSVVKPVDTFFDEGMREAGAEGVLFIRPGEVEIMPHDLLTPETTGADRLLASYAAKMLKPKEPVIVIQAGTALVVNAVDIDGVFRGGFILPGPEMWLDSLTSAAQLPYYPYQDIAWGTRSAGRQTSEAILGGAGVGLRGALREAVRILAMSLGGAPVLVFTGGWSQSLCEFLPGENRPDLVNLGIFLYAKNNGFI